MPLAKARIRAGDFTLLLPVNPYTAQWDYKENVSSFDTIGGRVVQLLSVQINGLSVSTVAGSRSELQKVAEGVRRIMNYHIQTSRPASFKVPSRAWDFSVYLQAMPQAGWDVAATTYPYQLEMAVEDDISGIQTHRIADSALTRLAENIGYKKAFHGGEASGFQNVVSSLLANSTPVDSGGGGGGADNSGAGTGAQFQGKNVGWPSDVANAPWSGKTVKDQIFNAWAAVFNTHDATIMTCIAERESGYQPTAFNVTGYYDTQGNHHWVYGLFQISDVHRASPWFPKGVAPGSASRSVARPTGGLLYNPEYNTRCAMAMAKAKGNLTDWTSTSGECGV